MAPDKDNVVNIGPATLSVGGADCGHTDENGLEVAVDFEIVRAFAGKYGKKSAVKTFIGGVGAKITAKMIETAN